MREREQTNAMGRAKTGVEAKVDGSYNGTECEIEIGGKNEEIIKQIKRARARP